MKPTLILTKKPKQELVLTKKPPLTIPRGTNPKKVALDKVINNSLT